MRGDRADRGDRGDRSDRGEYTRGGKGYGSASSYYQQNNPSSGGAPSGYREERWDMREPRDSYYAKGRGKQQSSRYDSQYEDGYSRGGKIDR